MSKELEASERIRKELATHHWKIDDIYKWSDIEDDLDIIETTLKVFKMIKESVSFSLGFDESQNEWSLCISNEKCSMLVAKGIGVKTYNLLKEALL